jgi:Na+/H+ antiporter NhaA
MTARLRKVPLTIFQRFFRTETLGGLVLLGFGLAALAIANSPLSEAYNHLWEIPLTVGIAPHELSLSFHEWINDGLMAVFFLLVGLEIKRELLAGELSSPRQAVLPLACAIGGMIVPHLFNFQFARGRFARLGHSDGNRYSIRFGRTQFDCSTCTNRGKSLADRLGHRRRRSFGVRWAMRQ